MGTRSKSQKPLHCYSQAIKPYVYDTLIYQDYSRSRYKTPESVHQAINI